MEVRSSQFICCWPCLSSVFVPTTHSITLQSDWPLNHVTVISILFREKYEICIVNKTLRMTIDHLLSRSFWHSEQYDYKDERIAAAWCFVFGQWAHRNTRRVPTSVLWDWPLRRVRLREQRDNLLFSVSLWLSARFSLQIFKASTLHKRCPVAAEENYATNDTDRGADKSTTYSDAFDAIATRARVEKSTKETESGGCHWSTGDDNNKRFATMKFWTRTNWISLLNVSFVFRFLLNNSNDEKWREQMRSISIPMPFEWMHCHLQCLRWNSTVRRWQRRRIRSKFALWFHPILK